MEIRVLTQFMQSVPPAIFLTNLNGLERCLKLQILALLSKSTSGKTCYLAVGHILEDIEVFNRIKADQITLGTEVMYYSVGITFDFGKAFFMSSHCFMFRLFRSENEYETSRQPGALIISSVCLENNLHTSLQGKEIIFAMDNTRPDFVRKDCHLDLNSSFSQLLIIKVT